MLRTSDRLVRVDHDSTFEDGLRAAVIELRRRSGKSRPPLALHAGDPGGRSVHLLVGEQDLDHWLRAEVVSALLRGAGPTCALVWLTRAGLPRWHDQDAAWVSPVLMAWARRVRRVDSSW